jgi:hypothetical protein
MALVAASRQSAAKFSDTALKCGALPRRRYKASLQGEFKKPNGAQHSCRFAVENSLDVEAA